MSVKVLVLTLRYLANFNGDNRYFEVFKGRLFGSFFYFCDPAGIRYYASRILFSPVRPKCPLKSPLKINGRAPLLPSN